MSRNFKEIVIQFVKFLKIFGKNLLFLTLTLADALSVTAVLPSGSPRLRT